MSTESTTFPTTSPDDPPDDLHAELRALIAASRLRLAGTVNAELTRLYWTVGERLHRETLGQQRAGYGDKLMQRLGERLTQEFGKGFEYKNLRRMVQFAQAFPREQIDASVMRQLSWTHFLQLLPLKSRDARNFYIHQTATERWSVRELRQQIERKAFERAAIASAQAGAAATTLVEAPSPTATGTALLPATVFKDPYFLDFLGLRADHDEADLENAILREPAVLAREAMEALNGALAELGEDIEIEVDK